ncbi:hypothetical protein BH11MYX1_BH11MYX1_30870 [soil metagenome]
MRRPTSNILLILVALCTLLSTSWADPRGDARTHYMAGQKAYAASDYKVAIKEFSAAQELAPADLNNYNLALCYDKIGDADNAINYYKQYLDKVPDAPKRSEIDASVARLEGAQKSAKTKKSDAEAKAKTDADLRAKADADAKAKADADAAKNNVIAPPVDVTPPPTGGAAGSTGTPSTGLTVSTGDAQLDRVQGINIDQIRDQRIGGSGMRDPRMGPAGPNQAGSNNPNNANAYGGPQPNGVAAMNNQPNSNGQPMSGQASPQDNTAPKETPVYKKWWFWVVVGVSAIVVYEIAFASSSGSTVARPIGRESTMFGNTRTNAGIGAQSSSGGFTLHF